MVDVVVDVVVVLLRGADGWWSTAGGSAAGDPPFVQPVATRAAAGTTRSSNFDLVVTRSALHVPLRRNGHRSPWPGRTARRPEVTHP